VSRLGQRRKTRPCGIRNAWLSVFPGDSPVPSRIRRGRLRPVQPRPAAATAARRPQSTGFESEGRVDRGLESAPRRKESHSARVSRNGCRRSRRPSAASNNSWPNGASGRRRRRLFPDARRSARTVQILPRADGAGKCRAQTLHRQRMSVLPFAICPAPGLGLWQRARGRSGRLCRGHAAAAGLRGARLPICRRKAGRADASRLALPQPRSLPRRLHRPRHEMTGAAMDKVARFCRPRWQGLSRCLQPCWVRRRRL